MCISFHNPYVFAGAEWVKKTGKNQSRQCRGTCQPSSKEFTIRIQDRDAADIVKQLASKDILAGVPISRLERGNKDLKGLIILASTEINTDDDRTALANALMEVLQ